MARWRVTNPNDTAANIRLAINVMAAYVVGDDAELSWSKDEDAMHQENGTFRLLQGFIALTGCCCKSSSSMSIHPSHRPETMFQKLANCSREHPHLRK